MQVSFGSLQKFFMFLLFGHNFRYKPIIKVDDLSRIFTTVAVKFLGNIEKLENDEYADNYTIIFLLKKLEIELARLVFPRYIDSLNSYMDGLTDSYLEAQIQPTKGKNYALRLERKFLNPNEECNENVLCADDNTTNF